MKMYDENLRFTNEAVELQRRIEDVVLPIIKSAKTVEEIMEIQHITNVSLNSMVCEAIIRKGIEHRKQTRI